MPRLSSVNNYFNLISANVNYYEAMVFLNIRSNSSQIRYAIY